MSLTKARELAVLSVLIAHPVHGYQIAAAFEKGALQLLGLKRAAVYAILSRFAERGWITEEEEPGGSFPDRRVNHVTDAGRAAVPDLVRQAGGVTQTPLMALMLLHDSGEEVLAEIRAQHSVRLQMLTGLLAHDSDHGSTASDRLAIASIQAEIKVLDQILEG